MLEIPSVALTRTRRNVIMRRDQHSQMVPVSELLGWRKFYAALAGSKRGVHAAIYQPWVDAIDTVIAELKA